MMRILLVLAITGCITQAGPRPETADYVIGAILVPYCGRGGCHTSATRPRDLAFDTIPNALDSIRSQGLVVPGEPQSSLLVTVLTARSGIMPPDQPLQDPNIELISDWVAAGAEGL